MWLLALLGLFFPEGFENDPPDGVILRRFTEEVVERDQIFREHEPQEVKGTCTAADK